MATYTGKQSVLDAALGKYKEYGFSLTETDDHLLELYFKDKKIATYNQTIPNEENRSITGIIREGCANYMKAISRWS